MWWIRKWRRDWRCHVFPATVSDVTSARIIYSVTLDWFPPLTTSQLEQRYCEESAWSPRQIQFLKLPAKYHSLACLFKNKIGVFLRRNSRETMKSFAVRVCLVFFVISLCAPAVSSTTRTYFIAAVERKWDYAPSGYNKVKGVKLEDDR